MRVAFRADASLQIGTGHVMRCLTLAQALALRGAACHFICREHEGHLIDTIRAQGFEVHALPVKAGTERYGTIPGSPCPDPTHSHWLGTTQADDMSACLPLLAAWRPDWLVVDHYALDARWEEAMAPYCSAVMVMDDLADRQHACQLLLDQTFARPASDYRDKVPASCTVLCGAHYALLRPEFAELREQSLKRRASPVLRELLVFMGGVDHANATCMVLKALCDTALSAETHITVVLGPTAPWLDVVRAQATRMPWPTRVLVGVRNVAELMCESDLAFGAAGATSWERCCLGLPTGMAVLAENQRHAARLLEQGNAVRILDPGPLLHQSVVRFIKDIASAPAQLTELTQAASRVTDGKGCERVVAKLMTQEAQ